jgi:hypothetical protein
MEDKIEELRAAEKDAPEEDYPLAFPIYPVSYIDHFFDDQEFLKQYGVPHEGIQIAATQ